MYYTTRHLLEELGVALPGNKSHSCYENSYNSRAYKRLCSEFGVSPDTDWRHKLDHGCQGLGSWSTFMTPSGAYRNAHAAQALSFIQKTPSSERKARRGRIFSGPGRDLMPKNNYWQILKTRLPCLLTSSAASLGIKNAPVRVHTFRLRMRNRALSDVQQHGAPPG